MEKELALYRRLTPLARTGGVVIFGGTEDRQIPLCELKQAFDLRCDLYDRSVTGLTVEAAIPLYDAVVAPLAPADLFLHIGEADLEGFAGAPAVFDQRLRLLLRHIRGNDEKCRVTVVSVKDHAPEPVVREMNRHLAAIAEGERCHFWDISTQRVWNPQQMRDVLSFLYSTGFVRPLGQRPPVSELAKILFCCG